MGAQTHITMNAMAYEKIETNKIDPELNIGLLGLTTGLTAYFGLLDVGKVKKGDVYKGKYESWYCVGCEARKTEKDIVDGKCTNHPGRKLDWIEEENWFFRLTAYRDRVLDLVKNTDFVQPVTRRNEVIGVLEEGLEDISISRANTTWGVPVPGDEKHVMYVWLDALTNYISALGGPADPGASPLYDKFWGEGAEQVHIVGKDILRFHAVYWPAFLLSAGITPPTRVWAHGWLTINGEKMSKRLGNFIPPKPLVDAFGVDVVRYYLMREVGFGQDGDFAHKHVLARYNGELANGLGNLLNRMVTSIVRKQLDGKVPEPGEPTEDEKQLLLTAQRAATEAAKHMDDVQPHRALEKIWELVGATNRYVDQTAPWALAKNGETEKLGRVAYTVLEALRWVSVMIAPFMPDKAKGLREQLGLDDLAVTEGTDHWPEAWGELPVGTQTQPGDPLFPRLHPKEQAKLFAGFGLGPDGEKLPAEGDAPAEAKTKTKKAKKSKKAEPLPEGCIAFDQFLAVELRVGLVRSAEPVEGSDKLLKLAIDLGEEKPRQVVAGIRKHYAPDDLVDKRVVVVANLAPRKIFGLESQGMVLAASTDDAFSVLTVEAEIPPGTRAS